MQKKNDEEYFSFLGDKEGKSPLKLTVQRPRSKRWGLAATSCHGNHISQQELIFI